MVDPLNDGHVEIEARARDGGKKRFFTAEKKTQFNREFTEREVEELFKTSEKTLVANGFGPIVEERKLGSCITGARLRSATCASPSSRASAKEN